MDGAPEIPFPLPKDHRVRPDLVKFDGPLFAFDQQRSNYRTAKERLQSSEPSSAVIAGDASCADIAASLHWLHAGLPEAMRETECAKLFDARQSASRASILESGMALARCVQEDLVLMHQHRMEAGWVCFPSHWNPSEKVGQSLSRIHDPVPQSERLQEAEANVSAAMVRAGPFVRYVWSLSFDPSLTQHPNHVARTSINRHGQVFFRSERQTTWPMPSLDRSWFLIRVYVAPIEVVVSNRERKALLRESLESMPSSMRQYKRTTWEAYEKLLAEGFFTEAG
jgi:hypothetical protein